MRTYTIDEIDYRCQFHQCFISSFCVLRSQKRTNTLMTWMSFCTFGIFECKSFTLTCWWNWPTKVFWAVFLCLEFGFERTLVQRNTSVKCWWNWLQVFLIIICDRYVAHLGPCHTEYIYTYNIDIKRHFEKKRYFFFKIL